MRIFNGDTINTSLDVFKLKEIHNVRKQTDK